MISITGWSQTASGDFKAMTITGGATLNGRDTAYLSGPVLGTGAVTIQVNLIASSVIPDTISARLFTSNDGVVYLPWPSTRAITAYDTLSATAFKASNLNPKHAAIIWELPTNMARFYQVRVYQHADNGVISVTSGSTIIRRLNGYN